MSTKDVTAHLERDSGSYLRHLVTSEEVIDASELLYNLTSMFNFTNRVVSHLFYHDTTGEQGVTYFVSSTGNHKVDEFGWELMCLKKNLFFVIVQQKDALHFLPASLSNNRVQFQEPARIPADNPTTKHSAGARRSS